MNIPNGIKSYTEASHKLNGGVCGWHCPCRNNYQCHPRKMKAKAHRTRRRSEKANLSQYDYEEEA